MTIINGDSNDNVLIGTAADDVITGFGGADTLHGGSGADVLEGGAGADALDGGGGIDTASYYTSAAPVMVSLATGKGSGGEAQGDTLAGFENLAGSQGNDWLEGDAGANLLQGWSGIDVLVGGAGEDMLTGGSGADRFRFIAVGDSAVGASADRITDFSQAQADRIDLQLIDADTGAAGNQAFSFIGTALYSGVAGELRYVIAGGVTTIAGDVDGDMASDFEIQLSGAMGLVALDVLL
jgi:Ca2+-binding RTX toxin-like protein